MNNKEISQEKKIENIVSCTIQNMNLHLSKYAIKEIILSRQLYNSLEKLNESRCQPLPKETMYGILYTIDDNLADEIQWKMIREDGTPIPMYVAEKSLTSEEYLKMLLEKKMNIRELTSEEYLDMLLKNENGIKLYYKSKSEDNWSSEEGMFKGFVFSEQKPLFINSAWNYFRVVGVKEEPKFRPFENTEMIYLLSRIVKTKCSHYFYIITGIDTFNGLVRVNDQWIYTITLFIDYEFEDGTPCGVEIENKGD